MTPTSRPPAGEPPVLVFADKYAKAHPAPPNRVRVHRISAAEAFTRPWVTDAHFAAYVSNRTRRLSNASIGRAHIEMTLLVGDVDDAAAHRAGTPASTQWREAERAKIARLREKHPGVYVYETRGGYRVLFRLGKPFAIASNADKDMWWRLYGRFRTYLAQLFAIRCDATCKDFTRLYRLPFVVREGQSERFPTYGDPQSIEALELPDGGSVVSLHPFVRKAMKAEVAAIRRAANGTRNDTLNKAAYALGGFVAGGHLDRNEVFDALFDAIMANGGDGQADAAKINDAIEAGMASPRDVPSSGRPPPSPSGARDAGRGECAPPPEGGREAWSGTFHLGDHVELRRAMLAVLQGKGLPLVCSEGALYRYDFKTGLWSAVDVNEQSRAVQSFSGHDCAGKEIKIKANDVKGAIALAAQHVADPNFFANGTDGIAFANGFAVVTAAGVELRPHSPDHRARVGYACDYVANAQPPMFLKFLGEIWRDDFDEKEKIAFTQEFGGIAMIGRGPKLQRCYMAFGKGGAENGANGKGTFADILTDAMPAGSITSVPPHIFENEYRRAKLAGKRWNVVSEVPEADILHSEAFKAVIVGDQIEGREIYHAPFDFRPRASHLFLCNSLPGTTDLTNAFFRRFVLVSFNRVFAAGTEGHDPDMAAKIIAAERHLIPSWLLDGAARALKSGHYTIPPSHEAELSEWRRTANQVALFLEEETVPSKTALERGHDWTQCSRVYFAYKSWAEETGHRPLAANKFGTRMAQAGRESKRWTPSKPEPQKRYYPVRLLRDRFDPQRRADPPDQTDRI